MCALGVGSQGASSFDGFNYPGEGDFWFSAETLEKKTECRREAVKWLSAGAGK